MKIIIVFNNYRVLHKALSRPYVRLPAHDPDFGRDLSLGTATVEI
jgi:hypothetical protein